RKDKKLEKKHWSRTHMLKRLYKVGLTARVISSPNDEALDKEDTSKQGMIDEIDADEDIAQVSTHDDVSIQDEGIEDVDDEEVVEAPKRKGVMIQEPEETTTTTKYLIHNNLSFRIKNRIDIEKAQQAKKVNLAWDDVQAKIKVDYQLAQRLQAEEQEQLIDAEIAKLFLELLDKRRKFFTTKRTKEKRIDHRLKLNKEVLCVLIGKIWMDRSQEL
nr:hypothetical protein [Tanacetum cinerariifolium]